MKTHDVYNLINKFFDKKISDEYCEKYKAYDNSGIIVDCGKEIKSVMFSLDLSSWSIEKASKEGCNLIVTHHPAIFYPIKDINYNTYEGEKLLKCIQNGISVISMHLNFDCAENGIDDCLAKGLGAEKTLINQPLSCGGYGKSFVIKPQFFYDIIEKVKQEFNLKNYMYFGDNVKINKVVSFCGGGVDDSAIMFAKSQKADLIVSSDIKHHQIIEFIEKGICVLQMTHYASENYGFKIIYDFLKNKIGLPTQFFYEEKLL